MSWLVLIFLVLGGRQPPDARYDRACDRLESSTGGLLTCDALEARLGAPATTRTPPPPPAPKPTRNGTGTTVRISNGF